MGAGRRTVAFSSRRNWWGRGINCRADRRQEAIKAAGNLTGKILIDATNPVLPDLSGLEFGCNTSAGELVAEWAAGAKVVKAFTTVGFNVMANPKLGGQRAQLFYCGDDGDAKSLVAGIATELDFDARDAGPLRQARLLEPFAHQRGTLARLRSGIRISNDPARLSRKSALPPAAPD